MSALGSKSAINTYIPAIFRGARKEDEGNKTRQRVEHPKNQGSAYVQEVVAPFE
jgi:hypothetical protein